MSTPQLTTGITLLGLGPGAPKLLTRLAWDWLEQISEIYLRTKQHPVVAGFPARLIVHSFDHQYERGEKFEEVYANIVEQVLELGRRPQGVTYAVPGHPFVAEATSPEIARRARAEGLPVRIIEGISFLEPVFSALEIDPFPRMAMMDAFELASLHHPNFPPDMPALITQIYDTFSASSVKLTLNAVYPDDHPVTLVHAAGTSGQIIETCKLFEIDRSEHIGLLTALYIPPLDSDTSLEAFQEVVARLRAPDGCPWDREQTHASLRKYLLEETYEALAALDAEDTDGLREELGDLMLQILLHAQIGSEEGEFTMAQVLQGIHRKIVRRHPHVFGEVQVSGVDGVLLNWQKLKEQERAENGEGDVKGMLDGVPKILPALSQAQEIQDRAARIGFDWPEIEPVFAKVFEELAEVRQAETDAERAAELGDLIFAVVNLVRWYKVDAESALRGTNQKFRDRFAYIEKRARETGRELGTLTLAEMDIWWEEAKDLDR
ncbi:MAG: bifunctional methyltransferase/pyrophosphohydrolase YabN [Bellilinea sp.]